MEPIQTGGLAGGFGGIAQSERAGEAMPRIFLFVWFEGWRTRGGKEAGRAAAEEFWREQGKVKPRQEWQLEHWAGALRGYFAW